MNQPVEHSQSDCPQLPGGTKLSDVICWSRIQAEAGQQLPVIVARKDLERQVGDGLFFWGVGNAPQLAVPELARRRERVDVVFSIMKSKPKPSDTHPAVLYVWRGFVDLNGVERRLPRGALVLSRGNVQDRPKLRHYALMCRSTVPLTLGDLGPFSPSNYRNVGGAGSPIGASQVTALLRCCADLDDASGYRINMRAQLTGSYWVRLTDPLELKGSARRFVEGLPIASGSSTSTDWADLVDFLREGVSSNPSREPQLSLFSLSRESKGCARGRNNHIEGLKYGRGEKD